MTQIPQAGRVSIVVIIIITLIAILGTAPTWIGASFAAAPAAAFFIVNSGLHNIHSYVNRCIQQQCTNIELGFIFTSFLLLPALAIYGIQLASSMTAGKLACPTKLHWPTMAASAAVPASGMFLWSLIVMLLGFRDLIYNKPITSSLATIAEPLFVYGYILTCSAAATLMVLRKTCETPQEVQGKAMDESLAALNKPVAPDPIYTHAH
jgi:hypothetical protein